ncbi:YIP1 family protein [Paracoccus sp. Z118]|uniref:YIP1 family protein n=1 Tax=Paracoccus sp. Z118 TaxID=2851017 RepID=UPI001C2C1527|nr:YIP1 family protein [Paracoccus sp. Z118]MBV0891793.1 YIP1 family protein [Paracoccus sp. Z118]
MIARLIDLISLSIREPAALLAALRRMGMGPRESWQAIIFAAAAGAILSWMVLRIVADGEIGAMGQIAAQPMVMAALQVGAAALFATLATRVGRLFGGTGRFEDALLATAFIEVSMLAVQVPQLLLSLLLPVFGSILSMLAFGLYFLMAVQLIRAIHGFRNPLLVALGMLGTVFVAGFVLSLLAASLGILPEVPA